MIISASRRTDIPAFFGDEFYHSLKKREFKLINPFNRKVSLLKFNNDSEIEGIVFWSKNPKNMFENLKKIKKRNTPFYFHFTINNYPENIEPGVPRLSERIKILKDLYSIISPYKIIWRYDPIILTEDFNTNFHIENFEKILSDIKPYIFYVTVSILTVYRKIKKNFQYTPDKKTEREIILKLNEIAKKYGIDLKTCCYNVEGVEKGKCIDASIFGSALKIKKDKGQRELCNCDKSVDIGYYRTCKHNCLYCYAL